MTSNEPRKAGRHFLQIPGPTPIPDRVLRAMDAQVLDHRGPAFQKLALRVLEKVKTVFRTKSPVVIFPASGTGAWEAALVNTLNPGDKVLMYETGQFATLWAVMAKRLGLEVDFIPSDWRTGVDPQKIEEKLREDKGHAIKAVCVVHHETSGGLLTDVAAVRRAIDSASHPALLLVDTVSGLGSADLRHDDWGIDVTVAGSQKGLMLPPGLAFTAISAKAIKASENATQPKGYWAWDEMLKANKSGLFPYTPATQILYGLDVAIDLINEEGLDNVLARHHRWGVATRACVKHWGLENLSRDERYHSPVMTAVLMPDGHGADAFRKIVLDTFDMSLGAGLNKVADKVFRIGHLGDTNDLTILGALTGVEMGLELAGIKHNKGGVQVAMASIAAAHAAQPIRAAAE